MPSRRDPDPEKSEKRAKPRRRRRVVVEGLLGVGLDGTDGHVRITKGEHVVLFGGSHETHEKMQEFTIRLDERMKAKGKTFGNVTPRELRDLSEGL